MDREVRGLFCRWFDRARIGDECWEWCGPKNRKGYGTIHNPNGSTLAHRVGWQLVNGNVPVGMELDHLCRNRACVRPSHLEAVTHYENIMRGELGHLHTPGEVCGNGHSMDESNAYIATSGKRRCRSCNREKTRRNRERQAERNV